MKNYSMYKISCKDPNITEIYIGSTGNFKMRESRHKSSCNNKNDKNHHNLKVYKYIRANGGWTNFNMTKISDFECDNTIEKLKEERRLVQALGATLNKQIPGRTQKEYKQDNKVKIEKYQKEYNIKNKVKIEKYQKDNKEKTKKYDKEYQKKNKDKIEKYQKEYREKKRREKYSKKIVDAFSPMRKV